MSTNQVMMPYLGVEQKITSRHHERLAVVYVRQSSVHQVQRHCESTRLQYGLTELADRLGWSRSRVLVIDEDQGQSGASAVGRAGFQRLLSEVALDHVGLILGVEMSRLARSCKDWYQLLELCAVFGTLICDLDGLYDPSVYNDRLLLGLKGTMSEAELHILQQRMLQGARQKARRGELITRLPIGYVRDAAGMVRLDPDEQARVVVHQVFDLFERIGTVAGVLKQMRADGLLLGVRLEGGNDHGSLCWRRPSHTTLRGVLTNPMYAGAYAYGRRGQRKRPGGQRGQRFWQPVEQWQVLIRDRFPSYISWTQYQVNLEQMRENRSLLASRGTPRRGRALLAGLVVCGYCGHRLMTRYAGKASQPRYCCEARKSAYGEAACQGLSAEALDREVVRLALLALEPSALEVSLQVAADLQAQQNRTAELWRQRLERADYDADRARRQYEAVEPENRLVGRTLEALWEQQLQVQRRLVEEHERWLAQRPQLLTESQQQQVRALAGDLPQIWHASTTADEDRKSILRQIIDRVVVKCEGHTQWVEAWVHWAGGQQTYTRLRRPVARMEQLADHEDIRQKIIEHRAHGDRSPQVAQTLNAAGHRTTTGQPFTPDVVRTWMNRYCPTSPDATTVSLEPDEWLVSDLARHLGISQHTVYGWIHRGRIRSRRTIQKRPRWIVRANTHQIHVLMAYRHERSTIDNQASDQRDSVDTTVTRGVS